MVYFSRNPSGNPLVNRQFMKKHYKNRVIWLLSACYLSGSLFACAKAKAPVAPRGYAPPPYKVPATQRPYTVNGKTYYPLPSAEGFVEEGYASWYGRDFHNKNTANGERFDMYGISAAHKILPINTMVRVTNLENGKDILCRINDRGPFVKDRILDLSYGAAQQLGIAGKGLARVRVEALSEGSMTGNRITYVNRPDIRHGRFYVQVGAFLERDRAYAFRDSLSREYKTVEVAEGNVGAQTFYRVQIFVSNDYDEAQRLEKQIEQRINPNAFLIAK